MQCLKGQPSLQCLKHLRTTLDIKKINLTLQGFGSRFLTQACRSCIQSLLLNLGNIYNSTLWPRSRQVRAHLGWSDAGWREESFNWQYKEKFFYRPSNNITDNWATVANIYRYLLFTIRIIFQRLIFQLISWLSFDSTKQVKDFTTKIEPKRRL